MPFVYMKVRSIEIFLDDNDIASFAVWFSDANETMIKTPNRSIYDYTPILIEIVEFFGDLNDAPGTVVRALVEDGEVTAIFDNSEPPDQKSVFFGDDKRWKDARGKPLPAHVQSDWRRGELNDY